MARGGFRKLPSGVQPNGIGNFPYWTPEEDDIVIKCPVEEVRKKLPHRSIRAIYRRRNRLKVHEVHG